MSVWVLLERKDAEPRRVSCELAAKAPELGDAQLVEVTGLERASPNAAAAALAERARSAPPEIILVGATPAGRDLAARLAAKLGWAYLSECADLRRDGDSVVAVRSLYAGKVRATVAARVPVVASVRANAFPLPDGAPPPAATEVRADPAREGLEFARFEPTAGTPGSRVPLAEARVVVSGGRGLRGPENWHLVEGLADVLGAALGASRAVTDAGWRPNEEQVGQTGKTVAPDLYVALGISGAIQHLAGMSSSRVIVAVNKDPDADLLKVADYAVVADLFQFVPALTEELRKVKQGS
ncbi:electron transfer flavoprotein subunit alpha/FixB family protein [soil metagenome]